MRLWEQVLELHRSGQWESLVQFYGLIALCLVLLVLLLMFSRARAQAGKARKEARQLDKDLKDLRAQISELEGRLQRRLDERMAESGDLIRQRFDKQSTELSESLNKANYRIGACAEDIQRVRQQMSAVEDRMPTLFDRLDEFRSTLAGTFQAELQGVLNSFDNSVSAILQQMKSDLLMGVSRIENIETMVRGRQKAEGTLLSAPDAGELAAAEAEDDFEEWGEEAKELAQEAEPAQDEEEEPSEAVFAQEAPPDEGPPEAGSPEPGMDDLEEGLYGNDE